MAGEEVMSSDSDDVPGIAGLMARMGGHGYGGSRDYCLPTIPCQVTNCPCNVRERCEMPSAIVIGADGVCEQSKKLR